MKDAWWAERGEELQAASDRQDTKALYEGLRKIYGPRSKGTSPLLSQDGNSILRDQHSIMARWVEHFDSVLNRVSTISDEAINQSPQRQTINELDIPLPLKKSPKQSSNSLVGNRQGRTASHQKSSNTAVQQLTLNFNACLPLSGNRGMSHKNSKTP